MNRSHCLIWVMGSIIDTYKAYKNVDVKPIILDYIPLLKYIKSTNIIKKCQARPLRAAISLRTYFVY